MSVPDELDDESERDLHGSITRYLTGLDNVGGVLIVDNGATISSLGVKPEEAQLLATREHVVREAARWLGLPTIVLADAGKEPTHASSEVFMPGLVTQAFRPMAVRIEQAIQRDLLTDDEQEDFYAEFLMDALLRGDLKARGQFYQLAIMSGWMNRNEVRGKENLNPGPEALDEYLEPMNMWRADDRADLEARPRQARRPAEAREQLRTRFGVRATLLALEAGSRIVRRELKAVERAAKEHAQDGEGWSTWLRTFYADHAQFVAKTLNVPLAVAQAYAARQGARLEASPTGIAVTEDWPWTIPSDLAALALGDDHVLGVAERGVDDDR